MIRAGKFPIHSRCQTRHRPGDEAACAVALAQKEQDRIDAEQGGDDEEFHDGGMRLGTNEDGRQTWQPDCECGWAGTETTDLDAAYRERDEHEQEEAR